MMGEKLCGLTAQQKAAFHMHIKRWQAQAWLTAEAVQGRRIEEIRMARDQIGKIVPAQMGWALPHFLERMYSDPRFRHLVGLRVCQWCFDDRSSSERTVEIIYKVIHITCIVDGARLHGGISETVLRLDPTHNRELGSRLTGILIRSSGASDKLTMEWESRDEEIRTAPINGRLIGGSMLNVLNPQRRTVHAVNGDVIWTPKPPS